MLHPNAWFLASLSRAEQMKKQNKIIVERKREEKRSGLRKDYQAKNYAEHKEVRLEKAKHNHIINREVRNVNSKERRKATKIENSKFEKRLQKFKEEIKDGPSFGCQCCHRALFYRGMKLIWCKNNNNVLRLKISFPF